MSEDVDSVRIGPRRVTHCPPRGRDQSLPGEWLFPKPDLSASRCAAFGVWLAGLNCAVANSPKASRKAAKRKTHRPIKRPELKITDCAEGFVFMVEFSMSE